MADLTKIRKRDGRVVKFDEGKITRAILAAFTAVGEIEDEGRRKKEAVRLTKIVVNILRKGIKGEILMVEQVQDVVEQVLMAAGHYEPAKAYIIYREKHKVMRKAKELLGVEDDLDLSVNQLKVLENRYLRHDDLGKVIETPKELFRRVARYIAGEEKKSKRKMWEERFYEMMAGMEFVPAGCYFRGSGTKSAMLANCFVLPVEDKMEAIFDAVKWLALIQQKGGGCIAGDSKVFTSFCGLEDIKTVYQRLSKGRKERKSAKNGWEVKIDGLNIDTLGFNPKDGKFIKQKILSMWKYLLPKERIYNVKIQGGMEVKTSDWHPFFVFERGEVIEKRADELREGDYLISGNPSIGDDWLFDKYQVIDGIKINEEISWLAGYILGDGSFGRVKANTKKKKYYDRLRLFDGRRENLVKAQRILEKLTKRKVSIQKDSRCNTKILTLVSQRAVKFLKEITEIDGPKNGSLKISSKILKAPISVIAAVLAGLLDSDGHVAKDRNRVTFDTESLILAEQIMNLLSLMGISSRLRKKKPIRKNWNIMYEVTVDGGEQLERLKQLLGSYLTDKVKKTRLWKHVDNIKQYSDAKSPLRFEDLKRFLRKAGVPVDKTEIHRSKVKIGGDEFWLQRLKWGDGLSCSQIIKVLQSLLKLAVFSKQEKEKLEYWLRLHLSFRQVVKIERGKKDGMFFDFTTDGFQNYLGGRFGLAVVHNTGFNFSKLRPKGDYVKSSGGFATGPVSFMKVFDAATAQVMQGGYRMGANMGILDVDHPDIMEFVTCKTEEGEISNFNISVGARNKFMEAVKKNKNFELVNPRNGEVVQIMKARHLFSQIVALAWRTGDPGMIFLDRINKDNPVKESLGELIATNPCGEQPLHPFDVCNLGSVNLAKLVKGKRADWERLERVVRTAVRFLDNGVSASKYPIPQVAKMARGNRRIGLGVMGWADMLYQLGIKYDSEAGVKLAGRVMRRVNQAAVSESEKLAKEKGVFKNWQGSEFEKKGIKRRNLAVTTIAPTGTISMVADCSSGIEPVFALSYVKNVVDEAGLSYVNPYFRQAVEESNLSEEEKNEVYRKVARTGTCQDIEELPDSIKRVFVVAYDIKPEWHVKMQAAFQKFTENAVSKTINFPREATIEEVEKAYMLAWELGCKGITIYRSGSKEGQILKRNEEDEGKEKKKQRLIIQSKVKMESLKAKIARNGQRKEICPECGAVMEMSEGCATCRECGFSKCSV